MTIQTEEKQASRLASLLNIISDGLVSSGSAALSPDDQAFLIDDLPTLALMQRLAFRALAQPYDNQVQTPRINADFEEVKSGNGNNPIA